MTTEAKPGAAERKSLIERLKEDPLYGLAISEALGKERKDALESSRKLNTYLFAWAFLVSVLWGGGIGTTVERIYLVQKPDGTLESVQVYDGPRIAPSDVRSFAQKAGIALHDWNYLNAFQTFNNMTEMVRADVLDSYIQLLLQKGVFEAARQRKQYYTAIIDDARGVVELVSDMPTPNGHAWLVRMPILEELRDSGGRRVNRYNVELRIETVPLSVNPKGIQVTNVFEELIK